MDKKTAEQVARIAEGTVVPSYSPKNGRETTVGVEIGKPEDAILLILMAMQDGVLNADELEELELPGSLGMDADGPVCNIIY